MTTKSVDQLQTGLDLYLLNGYVESNSFNDPNDDALEYLGMPLVEDQPTALKYCQRFLQQSQVNDELKSAALDFLLLSSEWSFAYQYLYSQAERLSIPELEKAFFYSYCDKNEATHYPVPEGLFTKLLARFEVVKDEPDAYFYHLHKPIMTLLKHFPIRRIDFIMGKESMTQSHHLIKVIADMAIFLEFTGENSLNPDAAVEMLEHIAAELKLLTDDEKGSIIDSFAEIAKAYRGDESDFVKALPDTLGLR